MYSLVSQLFTDIHYDVTRQIRHDQEKKTNEVSESFGQQNLIAKCSRCTVRLKKKWGDSKSRYFFEFLKILTRFQKYLG